MALICCPVRRRSYSSHGGAYGTCTTAFGPPPTRTDNVVPLRLQLPLTLFCDNWTMARRSSAAAGKVADEVAATGVVGVPTGAAGFSIVLPIRKPVWWLRVFGSYSNRKALR